MFSQFKLSGKIVGTIVVVLACTSVLSFWITQRRINQQAGGGALPRQSPPDHRHDKHHAGMVFRKPGHADAKGNVTDINQVPAVAAWSVAQRYAQDNKFTFRIPALNPRNPNNLPDDFERRALQKFQRDFSLKEYSERATSTARKRCAMRSRYASPRTAWFATANLRAKKIPWASPRKA